MAQKDGKRGGQDGSRALTCTWGGWRCHVLRLGGSGKSRGVGNSSPEPACLTESHLLRPCERIFYWAHFREVPQRPREANSEIKMAPPTCARPTLFLFVLKTQQRTLSHHQTQSLVTESCSVGTSLACFLDKIAE